MSDTISRAGMFAVLCKTALLSQSDTEAATHIVFASVSATRIRNTKKALSKFDRLALSPAGESLQEEVLRVITTNAYTNERLWKKMGKEGTSYVLWRPRRDYRSPQEVGQLKATIKTNTWKCALTNKFVQTLQRSIGEPNSPQAANDNPVTLPMFPKILRVVLQDQARRAQQYLRNVTSAKNELDAHMKLVTAASAVLEELATDRRFLETAYNNKRPTTQAPYEIVHLAS